MKLKFVDQESLYVSSVKVALSSAGLSPQLCHYCQFCFVILKVDDDRLVQDQTLQQTFPQNQISPKCFHNCEGYSETFMYFFKYPTSFQFKADRQQTFSHVFCI